MSVKLEIKKQLKELALKVREAKEDHKVKQSYASKRISKGELDHKLASALYYDHLKSFNVRSSLGDEFRHKHIARCLLMGTPYKKIETNCRLENPP
ncbi:hypothetical protein N9948_00345 [bacterium]|nr:hypothetical protein [bacterium]